MYDSNTGQLIEEKVQCPYCGSTQLQVEKRGFKMGGCMVLLLLPLVVLAFFIFLPLLLLAVLLLPFGFMGANKTSLICLRCGKTSRPGGRGFASGG
jgi:DNA-directed RNA polymerase subunit RPC12/RpoP